jgi:hypothetical protein
MSRLTHSKSMKFNDQRLAVAVWNKIARSYGIDYALTGSFAIQLMTTARCVDFIEILVDQHAFNDLLDNITTLNSDIIEKISERWMVNIGDEKDVALQFVTTGSNNYPPRFMPPWGSPARDVPEFPTGEPNIFYHSLGFGPQDVVVPILSPINMLTKRIFDLATFHGVRDDDYRRCLDEIDSLLVCAHIFHSHFSPDLRESVIRIIKQHLVRASRRKSIWASLGLELQFESAEETETATLLVWDKTRLGVVYINPRLTTIEEPKPVVWNSDSLENKPPTVTAFREYPVYSHIPFPTETQIWDGIRRWHNIATKEDITYRLVGQVAAWLKGHDGIVCELSILMSEDGLKKLQKVAFEEMKRRRRMLAITPTNRHILVIDHQSLVGLALRICITGTKGYPNIIDATVTENATIPSTDGPGREVPLLKTGMLLEQVKSEIKKREKQKLKYATREEMQEKHVQDDILIYLRRFWEGKRTQKRSKKSNGVRLYTGKKPKCIQGNRGR